MRKSKLRKQAKRKAHKDNVKRKQELKAQRKQERILKIVSDM
jgi:hypothetical protein